MNWTHVAEIFFGVFFGVVAAYLVIGPAVVRTMRAERARYERLAMPLHVEIEQHPHRWPDATGEPK